MKAFSCPDCGASIKAAEFNTTTIECPYCNSSVIVPEELRPPPPPTPAAPPPKRQDITESPYFMGCMIFFIICAAIGITFFIIMRIVPTHERKSSEQQSSSSSASSSKSSVIKANIISPTVAFTFGQSGTGNGAFQNAHGIAVDGSGNLYVSDETARIQKFDSNGKFISNLTLPQVINQSDFASGPVRLFTDTQDKLYAVHGGSIYKFDSITGKRLSAMGGADYFEDAALKSDGGLALVSWKNQNSNLVYLDSSGAELKRIPGFLRKRIENRTTILVSAMRIAVDTGGNTYVVYALGTYNGGEHNDSSPIAVYKFAPDGNYLSKFGLEGRAPDQLEMPTSIAVDHQNRVFVSEVTGDIKVFDADGNYQMTIKTPHSVQALAFDKDNNLYIAGASKVSKLVLNK